MTSAHAAPASVGCLWTCCTPSCRPALLLMQVTAACAPPPVQALGDGQLVHAARHARSVQGKVYQRVRQYCALPGRVLELVGAALLKLRWGLVWQGLKPYPGLRVDLVCQGLKPYP